MKTSAFGQNDRQKGTRTGTKKKCKRKLKRSCTCGKQGHKDRQHWVEENERNADKRNDTMRKEYKKQKVRNLMDKDVSTAE